MTTTAGGTPGPGPGTGAAQVPGAAGLQVVPPEAPRPLRKDAERNRIAILDAARSLITSRGLEVSFEEIARAAGVGAATVHRRFPDRAHLVLALFEDEFSEIVGRVEQGLTDADPWRGLCTVIHWTVEQQATNRGLTDVLTGSGPGHEGLEHGRRRLEPLATALVERAQRAGRMRGDVQPLDVQLMMAALAGIGGPDDGALRRRVVDIALDGLRYCRAGHVVHDALT